MRRILLTLVACAFLFVPMSALAQIRITEWEYNGLNDNDGGEFVELINIGTSPINMAGWSFDDASGVAGSFSIGGFGIVQPKEVVIISEAAAADFRTAWNLPASVKVVGPNNQNLSRNDGLYIFDNTSTVVDFMLFGDQDIPGTIRTQGFSGNPMTVAALGAHNVALWKRSAVGDEYGSYASVGGNIGNPGKFLLIPEPSSLVLLMLAVGGCAISRRGR